MEENSNLWREYSLGLEAAGSLGLIWEPGTRWKRLLLCPGPALPLRWSKAQVCALGCARREVPMPVGALGGWARVGAPGGALRWDVKV